MRNQIIGLIICAFLTAPASAVPVVKAYQYNGYHSGGGGEFTMVPSDWDWDPLVYYAESTKNIGQPNSFQTFCMEFEEVIEGSVTYKVTFSNKAINGGVGPEGDPISVGTAWLYQEFVNGTLNGYDYTPGDSNAPADHRELSADYLQDAIWWLEGEILEPANIFSDAAIDKFGSAAAAMADNNGQYPVMVMNNWGWDPEEGDYTIRIQDTLVYGIPEPATILLFGLSGAVVMRHRRR